MQQSESWVLERASEPLVRRRVELEVGPGDVVLEVEACGLCHTDLAFARGEVAPRHPLPLVLGHEIVGRLVDGPSAGRRVLVPAVIPCGECPFCRAGRGNACPRQKMPGNDVHGGFGTHVAVPGHALVPLDGAPPDLDVRALSVVGDAVSTAYQAAVRAELCAGDLAVVVGAGGGVGGYAVQVAKALGAKTLALDVSTDKLATIAPWADLRVGVGGRAPKDVRKEVQGAAKELGVPSFRQRIFECSGTKAGQLLAFTLLGPASTLVQVGFTAESVEVRLSNLMAFDATVHGSWGCKPELIPAVLGLVYAGKISLGPFVEHAPMSRLDEWLRAMAAHELTRRLVLDPRA